MPNALTRGGYTSYVCYKTQRPYLRVAFRNDVEQIAPLGVRLMVRCNASTRRILEDKQLQRCSGQGN